MSESTFANPAEVWEVAQRGHAQKLDDLRELVRIELDAITVHRHQLTINVDRHDREHVVIVVDELREAGWGASQRDGFLYVSVPESIRNPWQQT